MGLLGKLVTMLGAAKTVHIKSFSDEVRDILREKLIYCNREIRNHDLNNFRFNDQIIIGMKILSYLIRYQKIYRIEGKYFMKPILLTIEEINRRAKHEEQLLDYDPKDIIQ